MAIDDNLTNEIDQIRDVLNDDSLSAEGAAHAVLDQIEQMVFPPERKPLMEAKLRELKAVISRARSQDSVFEMRRAAAQLIRDARMLAQPLPPITARELVARHLSHLESCGWNSVAIKCLEDDLQKDETALVRVDARAVQTNTRTILKADLIARSVPINMVEPYASAWLKRASARPVGQESKAPSER